MTADESSAVFFILSIKVTQAENEQILATMKVVTPFITIDITKKMAGLHHYLLH